MRNNKQSSDGYFMCRANDICKESRRQIINAEDVFKALEETEFAEFIRPLRASLEGYFQLPLCCYILDTK